MPSQTWDVNNRFHVIYIETDLAKLLGIPASAAKVSTFLFAIGELYQYSYILKAEANDDVSNIGNETTEIRKRFITD